jgi:hypothetical protein
LPYAIAELARGRLDERVAAAGLVLTGDPYPAYDRDDPRSASRQCVALGAAVAAAGLTGRVREVEPYVARPSSGAAPRRPWVVERLPDDAGPPPRRAPWWRRLLDRLRGR